MHVETDARPGARTLLAVTLAVLLTLSQAAALLAAVELARFEATPQADNTIKVEWETGSELNTVVFLLYRNETGPSGDWGQVIYQAPASNSPTGQTYTYPDAAVQPGVKYYYRLDDVNDKGATTTHGPVSAGIGLPANTATPTRTPTTPGATSAPTVATGATVGAPPTATRQFTNTPPPLPGTTPQPGSTPVLPPPANLPTATPIGPAVVTTPTRVGGALPPPVPTLGVPTLAVPTLAVPTLAVPTLGVPTLAAATVTPVAPTVLPSPTAAVIAQVATALPLQVTPRSDAGTPVVFEAVGTRQGVVSTAQPGAGAAVAGRALGSTLAAAGAAVVLAGLVGGVAYLMWRARR